jgi:hypothetical protein
MRKAASGGLSYSTESEGQKQWVSAEEAKSGRGWNLYRLMSPPKKGVDLTLYSSVDNTTSIADIYGQSKPSLSFNY